MKLLRTTLAGLMLLSLTACGTRLVVSDSLVMQGAPLELLQPTPEPELTGPRINKSIAEYIARLKDALKSANDDKEFFLWWWKENTK